MAINDCEWPAGTLCIRSIKSIPCNSEGTSIIDNETGKSLLPEDEIDHYRIEISIETTDAALA